MFATVLSTAQQTLLERLSAVETVRTSFFDDAEAEPMPLMLQPASWEDIKQFFLREAPALLREDSGPGTG